MIADLDIAHVFDVRCVSTSYVVEMNAQRGMRSPVEMQIIQHPYSCYVLGRSGTGSVKRPLPKSTMISYIFSIDRKTTTMLFKMLGIQRAFENLKGTMHKPRQVFVTQSRVLAVKVEEYFTKLLDSLATGNKTKEELAEMVKSKRQQQQDEGLVDIDDDQNWRPDLPSKYSELRDEHFPLFLTFDKVGVFLGSVFFTYSRFSSWPHCSKLTLGL